MRLGNAGKQDTSGQPRGKRGHYISSPPQPHVLHPASHVILVSNERPHLPVPLLGDTTER